MTPDRRIIPAAAVESVWRAPDGHALRRIDWEGRGPDSALARRGAILFLAGRGDFYEKYLETLAGWAARGWRVTALDWRGQAGSGRLGLDAVTGHVGDFGVWVDDLRAFWREWKAATPGPHVLAGHSMGGHLALRAIAEAAVDPAAAVLVAPMLGLARKGMPVGLLHFIARLMTRIGDPRRPAWKWSERPGQPPESRIELLTHDPVRYADEMWWRGARPELVMGPGSWGWLERACDSMRRLAEPGVLERVGIPILILGAAHDRLVDVRAIRKAALRLPHARLVLFGDEARHEILRESDPVRGRALEAIDAFLEEAAPAAGSGQ